MTASTAGTPCPEPTWIEADRLAALDRYAILDTGREAVFDDVAALAADLLDAPMAVINLIAEDRQWFKAEVGIGTDSLPLDVSICRHAILQPGVMVVPDLQHDPRFDGNPLVHVAGGLRFYAGALLETPDGLPLGTVCVLGREPRPLGISERQSRALSMLARQAMAQIELRRSRDEAEAGARRQSFLLALDERLRPLSDPHAAMGTTAETLGRHLGAMRVGYGEIEADGEHGVVERDWAAEGAPPLVGRHRIDGFGPGLAAALRAGRTVAIADLHDDPLTTGSEVSAAYAAIGVRALIAVPLLKEGRFAAVLYVHAAVPRQWGEDDVMLAQDVVERTWSAVDRARALAALTDREERLRLATDHAEIGFWDVEAGHGTLFWPPRVKAMFGIPADRAVTMDDFHAGLHPDDKRRVAEAYTAAADPARRALYDVEYRTIGQEDGVVRWVAAKGRGVFDGDGPHARCLRVLGTAIDVTARKQAEAALAESEARFRNMADHAPVMMWTTDPSGACTYLNRGWHDFTGQTEAEGLGLGWLEATHPDDRADAERVFLDANARAAPFRIDYRLRRADGAYRWAIDAAAPRFGPKAEFLGYIGSVIDITERRAAEDALGALNADLERQVIERTRERALTWEVSPDLLGALDPDGYFRTSNPAWFTLLGWTPEEVARHSIWELLHPDDLERTRGGFELTQVGEPAIRFPNRYRHKDGSYRWISWVGIPVDGMVYCTGRDITVEREQAEALAERTAELTLYRNVMESDRFPICAYDACHRVTAFNAAHLREFVRVMGRPARLGEVLPDLFPPAQATALRGFIDRALAGETFTVEAEFGDADFTVPHWELDFAPLRDEAGRIVGAFHHARDVTERFRARIELDAAQEALRQSQKMEAMGHLTGGVAHDFNNLLTPIVGVLDRLQRQGGGSERDQRLIAGAAQSAERARTLVHRLLAFARRQPLQTVAVDVAELVRSMADLVASTTGPQVQVVVEVADDLPAAMGDPNQLEMALLNLAVNARDAMPKGGTLRIGAMVETVRATDERKLGTKLTAGRYVRLSVADTGVGMDEATLARAVEPFFSTKGVGQGTGLGLSMVHGLASQLGGALAITSGPGLGTNVELWLPESDAVPGATAAAAAPAALEQARGIVLLVDDEEAVRLSTADMLGELGYQVLEAASADEALAVLRDGAGVDLLITDHLMPGMTGTALARAVQAFRPGIPVLVISGYAESEGIEPDLPRLAKPFRRDELAASLAGLTGARVS